MNKTWVSLIILAVVTLLAYIAYQFVISLSGGNVDFNKPLAGNEINPNLGTQELEYVSSLQDQVLIKNEELD